MVDPRRYSRSTIDRTVRGVILGEDSDSKSDGPGSNPGAPALPRFAKQSPRSVPDSARDASNVVDQVRFLARVEVDPKV
jgi:hypothetical protein